MKTRMTAEGTLLGPVTTGPTMGEIMNLFQSGKDVKMCKEERAMQLAGELVEIISSLDTMDSIQMLNDVRVMLHEVSPFKKEPVDCVLWVVADSVTANDYNPNAVAPPEMELLRLSIMEDGYTQPLVTWQHDDTTEVIDGFHRNRVGRECEDVYKRLHGFLPIAVINNEREDRGDRIASTIRHNRARGKHKVDAMSEIVVELKRRNWSPKKIGKELGMDPDEVLRLCQLSGLTEMFADNDFSEAWEAEIMEASIEQLE